VEVHSTVRAADNVQATLTYSDGLLNSDDFPVDADATPDAVTDLCRAHKSAVCSVGGWPSLRRERIAGSAVSRAIPMATCDTRSRALSELLDWRSTDVS
jgi:hypothetical protein